MSATPSLHHVEEFQGLYGPFQVSELLIQRIWMKQAFDVSRLCDSKGRRVVVEYSGDWNRLDGPDFRDAVLRIGENRVVGDVEIHFSEGDWSAHGHDCDGRYDRVILHVLYHLPQSTARVAVTSQGRELPYVALMPLIWYDLEEYAEEDSIVAATGSDHERWVEDLLSITVKERREVLLGGARERWNLKRSFAGLRVERLGWEGACHQTALEILGYRHNRIPMLQIAAGNELRSFASESVDLESIWESQSGAWRMSGCRPANYPRLRLQQYAQWCQACLSWPDRMKAVLSRVAENEVEAIGDVSANRRIVKMKALREEILSQVVGRSVSGTKLDTLVCDGFLPLLAAGSSSDFFAVWFAWYVGNVPEACRENVKTLQVLEQNKSPACNGWAQGILKRMLK